jgi:hypothetical protein
MHQQPRPASVPIALFRTILCLFALAAPFGVLAQTLNVSGKVVDGKDNQAIIGAVISLTLRSDSTQVLNSVTDVDGAFTIPQVPAGSYILRTNYLGYTPIIRDVNALDAAVDLGTISMAQSTSALGGVTITAEQLRAQQSGDTTSFNAGAYKTNPDATTEDLIGKMPGISNDGGTLKVNGEDVKRILVDGKEFFGDDVNAAIKNLPAEIVDRIQVFDRASDQSQFTGFDDGNQQKTINIVTKRGRNNGSFGRLSGGYGLDLDNNDSRYTLGGNVNFFNGDRRVSIVALGNNVNQQNFSSEDLLGVNSSSGGGGRSGGFGGGGGSRGRGGSGVGGNQGGGGDASNFLVSQQGGITQTQSAGINYSDQWGPKLKVTGSYFFNRAENTNTSRVTRNYIVNNPDSALVYREDGTNASTNTNHRANLRLEWQIDSNNSVIIQPRVSFQQNESDRVLSGTTTLGAIGDQSRIENRYEANNTGYSLNNQLTYRHKFAKQGRTISLNVGTQYNNKSGDGLLYSNNNYSDGSTDLLDQRYSLDARGTTLSGSLNYTEPLTRRSQLQVNYSPSWNRNVSDRETYNRTGAAYTDLDTGLTNKYDNDYYYQRGGVGYRFGNEKLNFNANLNAQYATLTGDQSFPFPLDVNRNFTDLLPQAMLNYKFSKTENIRVMYRSNTNAPNISQLQNIVDNSNPLLLRTGNPDLRQDYTHSVVVRYGKTTSGKGNGLFLFANGSFTNNYIGNTTVIALNDTTVRGIQLNRGSQLSLPVNLDGNYAARSFLTYALPVTAIKTNLNFNAGVNYNRIPAIINSQNNFANSYALNGGFVAGSNISENIDFTLSANGAYSIVKNTLQAQSDYNYYTQTTSLRLNWIFLNDFVFNTNLNHTLYSGLGEGYDQQFLLWNASLGYKFLKDRSMQVDLYAFDILKQNRAISRTITDSYIEDAQTQVLQRYGMVRLSYTLRSFKNGAPREDLSPDRSEGRRGERNRETGQPETTPANTPAPQPAPTPQLQRQPDQQF